MLNNIMILKISFGKKLSNDKIKMYNMKQNCSFSEIFKTLNMKIRYPL